MAAIDQAVTSDALRFALEVWHPDCWVLETTRTADVGLLSYGCFPRPDGDATTYFTMYGDTSDALDAGVAALEATDEVYAVAEMKRDHRTYRARQGNATRELLVDHDGTGFISDWFVDRGFVPAEPIDTRSNAERWTLLTSHGRDRCARLLDEIRAGLDADIRVLSVSRADRTGDDSVLPLDRLSSRQREVLRLARVRGYYEHPRRVDAGDLAAELGVSTSTFHEHLRKAEAELLSQAPVSTVG